MPLISVIPKRETDHVNQGFRRGQSHVAIYRWKDADNHYYHGCMLWLLSTYTAYRFATLTWKRTKNGVFGILQVTYMEWNKCAQIMKQCWRLSWSCWCWIYCCICCPCFAVRMRRSLWPQKVSLLFVLLYEYAWWEVWGGVNGRCVRECRLMMLAWILAI